MKEEELVLRVKKMFEELYNSNKHKFIPSELLSRFNSEPLVIDIKIAQPYPIYRFLNRLEKVNQK